MARAEKVSVSLTPEMAAMRQVVETGEYASASAIMREALRDWTRRRSEREQAVTEIGRHWDAGIASGPSMDGGQAFEQVRSRFEARWTTPRGP